MSSLYVDGNQSYVKIPVRNRTPLIIQFAIVQSAGYYNLPTSFSSNTYYIGATQIDPGAAASSYKNAYNFFNFSAAGFEFYQAQEENPRISYIAVGY